MSKAIAASVHVLSLALVLLLGTASAQGVGDRIVFVCEHGSVKSLIAASLFDRAAEKRGLPFRAVARGVNPEERVPPASVDYAAARAALQIHIDALLDDLQRKQPSP